MDANYQCNVRDMVVTKMNLIRTHLKSNLIQIIYDDYFNQAYALYGMKSYEGINHNSFPANVLAIDILHGRNYYMKKNQNPLIFLFVDLLFTS